MTKRKALGSGLDSLLSSARRVTESETSDQPQSSSLPVHKIVRNRHQPRKVFRENEIKQLADSINENGQISPIVVRKMGEKFELIVGERRWRATQLLKKDTIDAVIIDADEKLQQFYLLLKMSKGGSKFYGRSRIFASLGE